MNSLLIDIASLQEAEYIENKLHAFNLSKTLFNKMPPWDDLRYTLKNEDSIILGGITGALVMGNYLSIHKLWLDESARGQGHGAALLNKIESESIKKGAAFSQVDSYNFQSPGFYQKHGYKIFATMQDSPVKGCTRFYMVKYFK